ncbi:MAG: redoxin domain-containing protein [Acidimicrobiales bacterium]
MDAFTQVGDVVPALTLQDVDGKPVELDDLLDRPVAIPLVRYYGCMPCRDFLMQLNGVRAGLDLVGVGVVGVGGAAGYQARHLMSNGVGFPLLLDPDHQLYEALDVRRIHWWMLLSPVTWWKYVRSVRRARQGRITAHPLQAPGFVILDTDRTVRFLYRGRTLGDYPSVRAIVTVATSLGADRG